MSWSKLKQQLDSFLSPALKERVEYRAPAYRYWADKPGTCYITVDKKNVLNLSDKANSIKWYPTELDIKHDPAIHLSISRDEIEAIREELKGPVPEDRLYVIARNRKSTAHAKELMAAQAALSKSNFIAQANTFLTTSLEKSLESQDILLNILALVDKRLGKKRILDMSDKMKVKHPAVQYFYELRRSAL
ncbi:SF0329 family protein [Gorillibacterium sp. sgz500922]|uniref:SF0329 family protein n=1 Tax=Gorillibacterium sp. sgz500922 TaxID=3446694 RepID=UPI003F681FAD